MQVLKILKETIYAILWILFLPLIPLMYALYRKHTVKNMNIKTEIFKKEYYEVFYD
jgi:RsiW-degrading membrane proteinase PrsW (M82 family)